MQSTHADPHHRLIMLISRSSEELGQASSGKGWGELAYLPGPGGGSHAYKETGQER